MDYRLKCFQSLSGLSKLLVFSFLPLNFGCSQDRSQLTQTPSESAYLSFKEKSNFRNDDYRAILNPDKAALDLEKRLEIYGGLSGFKAELSEALTRNYLNSNSNSVKIYSKRDQSELDKIKDDLISRLPALEKYLPNGISVENVDLSFSNLVDEITFRIVTKGDSSEYLDLTTENGSFTFKYTIKSGALLPYATEISDKFVDLFNTPLKEIFLASNSSLEE